MIEVKDLSYDNLDDAFTVCDGVGSAANIPESEVLSKGKEIRTEWLKKMLAEYGSCSKVAYLDGRPVARVLFYPEEAMKYMKERRKNVIHLQCVVNPFTEAQGLGAGAALINSLIDDCRKGLDVLCGEKCSYLVAYPYPVAFGITFSEFYTKMGFKQGENEFYYEVTSSYSPRKKVDYTPLPEDKGKVILFYNPTCEYGYFYVNTVKKLFEDNFEDLPIKMFNLWENPEEYCKRPQQTVVVGRATVNQQPINDFLFWEGPDVYLKEVKSKLENDL